MRHPYGIWNNKWIKIRKLNITHYETSLWDLKHSNFNLSGYFGIIMRHPYGIWNFIMNDVKLYHSLLWDIPMGFETNWNYRKYRWASTIMRHPYGIWNIQGSMMIDKVLLDYETSLWDLKPSFSRCWLCYWLYYETSLWDLKHGAYFYYLQSRINYETSLWDLKLVWCGKINNPIWLWDIPMGFETWWFWFDYDC